ncbi:MAG: hypothetical protein KF780_09240 [Sphingomonas sp.]|nr:hypothetical protein [Sphingomonas sp.]
MLLRKLFAATALSAALLLPAAVSAQTLSVGTPVTDPDGGPVGTITAIEGDAVLLRTDRHEVRLPASSFAVTEEAALIGLTRDQLNTQVDQMLAQAQQAFVVGATLHDREGAVIGQVEALDDETLTVQISGQQVRLPRAAVAAAPNGLIVGATLAELQSQLTGDGGAN